jgi:flagellar biosynthesis anti-sigma factor FlgM
VALSSGAEAFRHARTRLDGVVAVPSDRVAALRARVAGGTYRVDGERIAATMLEDEATARLLGLGNGR